MESAVESALSTVNCILEDMNVGERVYIEPYHMHTGTRLAAILGKGILLWKGGGRSFRRLAGTTYSMPKEM
jgi:hypothetical protein